MALRRSRQLALGAFLMVAACADDGASDVGAFEDHSESADFEVDGDDKSDGTSGTFDRHWVMSDGYFLDPGGFVDALSVQLFFASTPYGGARSWLADERFGGETAAELIARVADEQGVSPLVLLARMQVEASLISKPRPSQSRIDKAFGCGCFDGQACFSRFSGFEQQAVCAAETFRKLYDASVDGSGQWRKGKSRKTLDKLNVTPETHATAALYGYTPWVLKGRGGNWLAWNVTRKFARALGLKASWVGAGCGRHADCGFVHADEAGFCVGELAGAGGQPSQCALSCEGTCPDRNGWATTFCARFDNVAFGMCVPKSHERNRFCADVPGSVRVEASRYVGGSGVSPSTATVCAPGVVAR